MKDVIIPALTATAMIIGRQDLQAGFPLIRPENTHIAAGYDMPVDPLSTFQVLHNPCRINPDQQSSRQQTDRIALLTGASAAFGATAVYIHRIRKRRRNSKTNSIEAQWQQQQEADRQYRERLDLELEAERQQQETEYQALRQVKHDAEIQEVISQRESEITRYRDELTKTRQTEAANYQLQRQSRIDTEVNHRVASTLNNLVAETAAMTPQQRDFDFSRICRHLQEQDFNGASASNIVITTAVRLDEQQTGILTEILLSRFGRPADQVRYQIDPDVLGGTVIAFDVTINISSQESESRLTITCHDQMTDDARAELERSLRRQYGNDITFDYCIDPSIQPGQTLIAPSLSGDSWLSRQEYDLSLAAEIRDLKPIIEQQQRIEVEAENPDCPPSYTETVDELVARRRQITGLELQIQILGMDKYYHGVDRSAEIAGIRRAIIELRCDHYRATLNAERQAAVRRGTTAYEAFYTDLADILARLDLAGEACALAIDTEEKRSADFTRCLAIIDSFDFTPCPPAVIEIATAYALTPGEISLLAAKLTTCCGTTCPPIIFRAQQGLIGGLIIATDTQDSFFPQITGQKHDCTLRKFIYGHHAKYLAKRKAEYLTNHPEPPSFYIPKYPKSVDEEVEAYRQDQIAWDEKFDSIWRDLR